ncbi:MAG: hypothetical protein LBC20_10075, partial [Planctomycetaceae bacterium]|nr:hypothetical protein [Planctomycetaceae bacterium]
MSSDVISNDIDFVYEIGISDATLRNWRRLGVSEKDHNKRLRSRANKRLSQRKFMPEEYSDNETILYEINRHIDYVAKNHIGLSEALFLAASNIIELENNSVFRCEMESWSREIGDIPKQHFDWFKNNPLNNFGGDILGLFYQSLLTEGQKSAAGSYYTPSSIV